MADFSVNQTELSGPSGAGTGPLAPVQQQAVDTGILPVLKQIGSIFIDGLQGRQKAQAAEQQNAVVGAYTKKQQAINDGIASGQIDPSRGSTMSRALFGQYLASNPQYVKDLHEAQKAFVGGTELGEAEQLVKEKKDEWKADMSLARSRGVIVDAQASTAVQQAVVANMKKGIVAEREFEQQLKRNAEARSASAEERTVMDRELKESSLKLITQIAGDNLDVTSKVIQDLSDQVGKGLPYDQAQIKMGAYFAQIQSGLAAAASKNPELAAPYERIFGDLRQLGEKAINPKTRAETSAAEYQEIINRAKLVAVQGDPKLKKVIVASEMLGQNALVALAASGPAQQYLTSALAEEGTYKPTIVGSPDEKDLTQAIGKNLDKIKSNGFKDNEKASQEAGLVLKQYLGEVASKMNNANGAPDPKQMVEASKLIASDGFGALSKAGKIDSKTMQDAALVWQADYKPAIEDSIKARLAELPKGTDAKTTYKIDFAGGGVQFTLPFKGVRGEKEIRARQEVNSIFKDLKKAEAGVNQIIHAGAHLEGHTDYARYWEENKALMFPDLFEAPKGVNGDVKPVPVKTEDQARKAAVIQPNERMQDSSTPASNIAEIDIEIARERKKKEPSPTILRILQEERARWAK